MQSIKLSRSDAQVKAIINASYPSYRGRKIRLEVASDMLPSPTYWSGGSRSEYVAYHLSTGEVRGLPDRCKDPREFGGTPLGSERVKIPLGVIIVEHRIFCGKDSGLRFFVHPENAAPMLAAEAS
jgi:hypothetical protein